MKGKIYSVVSLVEQNGAKYLTSNLAFHMKKNKKFKNKKILLIDLDYKNSTLCYKYVKDFRYGLDDVILKQDDFSEEDFIKNVCKTDFGFDVLKGSTSYKENKLDQGLILKLLSLAKSNYDYTFIVLNPNADDISFIMPIMNSEKVIIVVKDNYSNEIKIDDNIRKITSNIGQNTEALVVFNYVTTKELSSVSKLLANYPVRLINLLKFEPNSVDNGDFEKKMFLRPKNINKKAFKEIVDAVTDGDCRKNIRKRKGGK